MKRAKVTSVVILLLMFFSGTSGAEVQQAFNIPPLGLTEIFQFFPLITGPDPVQTDQWKYQSSIYWMNIWAYNISSTEPYTPGTDPYSFPFEKGTYLIDMEVTWTSHSFFYGLNDTFDVLITVPVYHIGGGIMDGMIEGFHSHLGISQHRRRELGRDEINIFFVDDQGDQNWLSEEDLEGFHLGDIAIYVNSLLRSQPALSIKAGLKLPTQNCKILNEKDTCDGTLNYSIHTKGGPFGLYHSGGVIYFGHEGYDIVKFKRWRFISATTISYNVSSDSIVFIHGTVNSPAADYPAELDKPVFEVSMGLRQEFKSMVVDIGLIENMFYYDNSPDFGFYFNINLDL